MAIKLTWSVDVYLGPPPAKWSVDDVDAFIVMLLDRCRTVSHSNPHVYDYRDATFELCVVFYDRETAKIVNDWLNSYLDREGAWRIPQD